MLIALPSTQQAQGIKEQKQSQKLKDKHRDWNNCFVITTHGDTVSAKIRDRVKADVFAPLDLSKGKIGDDYSVTRNVLGVHQIVIAHDDETEEKLTADSFKELYVPGEDPEFRKYITIREFSTYIPMEADSQEAYARIYRVVTDGKCRLLFDQIEGGGGAVGSVSLSRYYVYYNGKLTKLRVENWIVFNTRFRKKCSEFFTDCPQLVEKINDKKYKSIDLRQIVTEFNECLAAKHM